MADQDVDASKAFVCWEYDAGETGFGDGKHHLATYNLVRCTKAREEGLKSEDYKTRN